LPNGKLKGVIRITIEEKEDLNSIIDRAAKLLWDGKKSGKRLFYDDGGDVLESQSIFSKNTLYISEGEDWIGNI
jgi:hypothetical protein